jgi:CheY-like chemotaxis protein
MTTKVLVVEDDQEINELLGEYLALENIQYLSATTGKEAIHLALTHHPDAIILDLMLPDVDGFEVARRLSTQRSTFDIPIVILSCMCQDCDKQKGYASGALFYMNKPFMPDDLLATLRSALDWRDSLTQRPPSGTLLLGDADPSPCSQALHQMIADLFARTDLSDAAISRIRETVETLNSWTVLWNRDHTPNTQLRMDYKVDGRADANTHTNGHSNPAGNGRAVAGVEWTLSESQPGILADAFFTPHTAPAGILGWGAGTLVTKPLAPIAPPAKWLEVLAKTGAATFEKDSKAHTVRFARPAGADGSAASGPSVPVVEIDGTRYPTRLRDEALAARQQ